jgi:hypothetical protein
MPPAGTMLTCRWSTRMFPSSSSKEPTGTGQAEARFGKAPLRDQQVVAEGTAATYPRRAMKALLVVASVALSISAVALLALNGAVGAASPNPGDPQVACVAPTDGGAHATERALARARRLLRTMTITNQSGRVRLTPRTYAVLEVAAVGPGSYGNRVVSRYFHIVRRQCSELQAERTWLVLVNISEAQLALPPMAILTTPTHDGWKVTLHDFDRSI